jgi:catechol 2,3-dioxygenase-like lactoylglutathione lyase family enzyme
MTGQRVALAFQALDPEPLARFWAHAIGWEQHAVGEVVQLTPTDDTGFRIDLRRTDIAKARQNRIHFDLTTASLDDQTGTVAELLTRGAHHVDIGQTPDEDHVVLADPEGNELCVLAPGSQFLAGCPRLGAVNCDGTHELGVFWSRALGWPLVWDHEEETAIQAPTGAGPKITWSGTPLMPRWGHERMHLHVAPSPGVSMADALAQLSTLGALTLDPPHGCPGAHAFADVDGNACCLFDAT